MSKKAVIVPKYKWCVVVTNEGGDHHRTCKTRSFAREVYNRNGGKILKVTKIVYYYE